jgi:hypothetical protein
VSGNNGKQDARKPNASPRLIDRVRDGALSMKIGSAEEGGVVTMISMGDRLITVKDKAIYSFQLADEIDPERKNINVQNVQQRLATVGADNLIVGRTLLTADKMLKPTFLRGDLDKVKLLNLYLDLVLTLVSANEIAATLQLDQESAVQAKAVSEDRVLSLPSIGKPLQRATSFVQKAEHAVQALYQVAASFIGEDQLKGKGKLFDGIEGYLVEKLGKDDPRLQYVGEFTAFCKFIRNARHCVEHMSEKQKIVGYDYALTAENVVIEPSISFIHPEIPADRVPMLPMFRDVIDQLSIHGECLVALLCGIECAGRMGAFNVAVDFIDDESRQHPKGVQYGYFVQMGEQWFPMG